MYSVSTSMTGFIKSNDCYAKIRMQAANCCHCRWAACIFMNLQYGTVLHCPRPGQPNPTQPIPKLLWAHLLALHLITTMEGFNRHCSRSTVIYHRQQFHYLGHTCWKPCRYSCSCADIVICLRLNLHQQNIKINIVTINKSANSASNSFCLSQIQYHNVSQKMTPM